VFFSSPGQKVTDDENAMYKLSVRSYRNANILIQAPTSPQPANATSKTTQSAAKLYRKASALAAFPHR
jgi:hypothetical protein